MDGVVQPAFRPLHPSGGAAMLEALYAAPDESARLLHVVLDFIPGAREFLVRFGNFVQDLPDPSDPGRTIFRATVDECLARLDPLGLSPLTVHAHLAGFPVVVRTAAEYADRAYRLTVFDSAGARWTPLSGPLSSFSRDGPVHVSLAPPAQVRPDRRLSTLVVLGHCLGFPQVAILAECWDAVAESPC